MEVVVGDSAGRMAVASSGVRWPIMSLTLTVGSSKEEERWHWGTLRGSR